MLRPMIYLVTKLQANFKNSMRGLRLGLTEHSFRVELVLGVVLVPIVIFIERGLELKVVVCFLYCLMLSTELLNTAIERLCNRMTTELDGAIRDIKDIASAAVFISVTLFIIGFAALLLIQP